MNLKRTVLYWRIFKRWIRQKFKIEMASYKCNLRMLIQMYRWAGNDIKNKKLERLLVYKDKLFILDSKEIKNLRIVLISLIFSSSCNFVNKNMLTVIYFYATMLASRVSMHKIYRAA